MTESMWIILGLLGITVYQHVFWSRQVQSLIDKLMSRNYAEYVQSKILSRTDLPMDNKLPSDNQVDEEEILNELNRMLPPQ